jgi:hypothetical protein
MWVTMLPNFIGLGAPKSATTWLFYCLREHPEVFVADSKEVMFFDYGDIRGRLPTYEEHFSRAGDAKAVGEFSTRYLASTRAPERVKKLIPDAKLIVSLRRPADQIYSHYWHLRRQNFHGLATSSETPTFEQALKDMEDQLLTPAYYYRNLSNWIEHFELSRIHVILYDDIQSCPNKVIRDLYTFLGVDAGFVPPALNPSSAQMRKGCVAGTVFKEKLQRRIYTFLANRIYRPLKSLLGVRRADRIKSMIRARETMDFLFHDTAYPSLSSKTRESVSHRFDSDVRELSSLIGRPLNHWLSEGK